MVLWSNFRDLGYFGAAGDNFFLKSSFQSPAVQLSGIGLMSKFGDEEQVKNICVNIIIKIDNLFKYM